METLLKDFIKKSPLLLFSAKKTLSVYNQFGSKGKWRRLALSETIKIELGSGPKKGKNGWTTIDQGSADISWDLRHGIPLPSDSVDKIYSSHLLEHIPYDQLIPFLRECRRVMKSNAEFSVCVPNFRFYVDAYKEGELFLSRETWWQPGLIDTGSCIDQLNYLAYMKGEHKYMFDEENLKNTLTKAGFSNVQLRDFEGELDLPERDIESIYAKAGK
jgi:predicted SAM-dependent methyltransferase